MRFKDIKLFFDCRVMDCDAGLVAEDLFGRNRVLEKDVWVDGFLSTKDGRCVRVFRNAE